MSVTTVATAVVRVLSVIFLLLALARLRWAYAIFIGLALLSFIARAGFNLDPHACELLVSWGLALFSFRNFPHIVLFALFFFLSRRQFNGPRASIYAMTATLIMGALVELAEGLSGQGHCRLRDLLPDAAGAVVGWVAFRSFTSVRRIFTAA